MNIRTIDVKGVVFNMLPVEGSQFVMGATPEQHGVAYENESPAHSVKIDNFYLGETVVTQTLWNAVMGEEETVSSELPVTGKSWNDCQTFIRKLNELTGSRFRLPTEAEWEFAARGGSMTRGYKYAGSNNLDEVAWYEQNSGRQVHPVKQKRANELGFYDMSGNVWEWCSDRYGDYEIDDEREAVLNPKGPTSGSSRVVRGAGNTYYAQSCRVSCRLSVEPAGGNYENIGFRLALDENDHINQSDTGSTPEVKGPHQNNLSKGGATGGGGAKEKDSKGGNGHYWKSQGGGSQRKKKKWPWIVAAAVVLLVIIIAASGGGNDSPESETPVATADYQVEPEMPKENPKETILKHIQPASKLFADNKLVLYQSYNEKIEKLNDGWNNLMAAEKCLMKLDTISGDISHNNYEDFKHQIDRLKLNYLYHITAVYDKELDNIIGLMKHPDNYKADIDQGNERIAQLERFSGIDMVRKESEKYQNYNKVVYGK